jgi:hypothetical protein
MVPNNTTFQDWLKAHSALLEAERRFSDMAEQYEAGSIAKDALEKAYLHVQAQRALCDAVFRKAVDNIGNGP